MNAVATITAADEALLALLRRLEADGYDFVTPTPATHQRVLDKDPAPARDVRDVLGWSRPFAPDALPREVFDLLDAAGVLVAETELWRSTIRVSRVRGLLFLHSAYPTDQEDAVFLGPDSYRFADFVAAELGPRQDLGIVADIGGGAGVGALTAAVGRAPRRLVLTDVNPKALRLARLNARHAGVAMEAVEASGLTGAPSGCDLVLANPPYIADHAGRAYRDGGGMHGGRLSLDWAKAAVPQLAPGGRMLLYTGAAVVKGGRNPLAEALAQLASPTVSVTCRELDPDVFGEELEAPAYRDVERIAAIGVVITKARGPAHQN